ncbi:MAG: hypothetical protein KC414_13645, partial [Romboutsia sp.]|nr:hypothetical protein [Romboutsia sp.]
LSHILPFKTNKGFVSIVTLEGVKDLNYLKVISDSKIIFVDKVGEISNIFKKYRESSSYLVILSYFLIFILLNFRYKFAVAVKIILPSLLAAFCTVILLTLIVGYYSIFHIIALLIVLGLGIDSAIFLYQAKKDLKPTFTAVFLSSLTTAMSFGLLTISKTAAIYDFGLTILIGIFFVFIFSPVAIDKLKKD